MNPHRSLALLLLASAALFAPLPVRAQALPPTLTLAQGVGEPRDLEERARQHYELSQWSVALELLQQALAAYTAQGDVLGQAIALRNLSLVHNQAGNLTAAQQAIAQSRERLASLANTPGQQEALAQTLEAQGQLDLARGQAEAALAAWQEATSLYQQQGNLEGQARGQLNQARAQQALGLHNQAARTLTRLQQQAASQADTPLKARILHSLGNVQRAIGRYEAAKQSFQESLQVAEQVGDRATAASAWIGLGNTARAATGNQRERELAQADQAYAQAAMIAPTAELRLQAQLNQLRLHLDRDQTRAALALVPELQRELDALPLSQTAVYARLNLAESLSRLAAQAPARPLTPIAERLATAIAEARTLGDRRAEAFALHSLGQLYERQQRYGEARRATEQSLHQALAVKADDIAYQAQWQLGRLHRDQGDRPAAIAAYSQAVKTLQSLRSDLVAVSTDVQFSFQEEVEPVYRQLADLLLQPEATQADLQQARATIEALQLAELDNFFRDACLDSQEVNIDSLDPQAAVFYTIVLADRLEVILALPGQALQRYSTPLEATLIADTLSGLRRTATRQPHTAESAQRLQRLAANLYTWLVEPATGALAAQGSKTLVFVLDGDLRNLPLAALHDGERYLIERYSLAIAPSLNLIDPQPLTTAALQVLGGGLTEARQDFAALPNVATEIEGIQSQLRSQVLLNDQFTKANVQTALQQRTLPIVHLATHGQFGSSPADTFLLTWDDRLGLDELTALLRADSRQTFPIELLVLSACQTAVGDRRAALGLAGVAVRAGARSTLASLWSVSDQATALLMAEFYSELASNPGLSKAEALRRAQVTVKQQPGFEHPFFWSAFVLVGNWL